MMATCELFLDKILFMTKTYIVLILIRNVAIIEMYPRWIIKIGEVVDVICNLLSWIVGTTHSLLSELQHSWNVATANMMMASDRCENKSTREQRWNHRWQENLCVLNDQNNIYNRLCLTGGLNYKKDSWHKTMQKGLQDQGKVVFCLFVF